MQSQLLLPNQKDLISSKKTTVSLIQVQQKHRSEKVMR